MAKQRRIREQPLENKIAIVCGGSKGIGKETAKEVAVLGGSVCLVARHREPLEATAREIEELLRGESQFVETIVCDTTDADRLTPLLNHFVDRQGVPDYLINVVGYARPQYVQAIKLDGFRERMEVNYYGQVVPILALLPHFMEARKGHIANVSSMMGYFGIMGYAAYAPTKFAIAGLTDALRHELKPFNITCSVLYPPDTDTPGFQKENESKPPECAIISGSVKLQSAQQVAEAFVEGILKKQVAIMPGEAGLVWRLNRYFPWLVRWMTDRQYEQAMRQTAGLALRAAEAAGGE
jgi:3-dehydrosphinganine reductase